MLSLRQNEVPEFLRHSALFGNHALNGEDHPICVYEGYFCRSDKVENNDDFVKLLKVISLWKVDYDKLPYKALFEWVEETHDAVSFHQEKIKEVSEKLYEELAEYSYNVSRNAMIDITWIAAGLGHTLTLKYIKEDGVEALRTKVVANCAAYNKQLECLKFVLENGAQVSTELCYMAVRGGSVECLRYVMEHGGVQVCELEKLKLFAQNIHHHKCVEYICELERDELLNNDGLIIGG